MEFETDLQNYRDILWRTLIRWKKGEARDSEIELAVTDIEREAAKRAIIHGSPGPSGPQFTSTYRRAES